jgi:hypothetical protein
MTVKESKFAASISPVDEDIEIKLLLDLDNILDLLLDELLVLFRSDLTPTPGFSPTAPAACVPLSLSVISLVPPL